MLSNHYYLGISCSEACSAWERAKLQAPRGQHNHSLNSCTIYCERQFILTSHRDRSNFVGGPQKSTSSFLPAPLWLQILKQITHMWPAMRIGPCWIGILGVDFSPSPSVICELQPESSRLRSKISIPLTQKLFTVIWHLPVCDYDAFLGDGNLSSWRLSRALELPFNFLLGQGLQYLKTTKRQAGLADAACFFR